MEIEEQAQNRIVLESTIVHQFATLFKKFRDEKQKINNEYQNQSLMTNDEIKKWSDTYTFALKDILSEANENGVQNCSHEMLRAVNSLFAWKLAEILFFSNLQDRAEKFINLISGDFTNRKMNTFETMVLKNKIDLDDKLVQLKPDDPELKQFVFSTVSSFSYRPVRPRLTDEKANSKNLDENFLEDLNSFQNRQQEILEKLQLLKHKKSTFETLENQKTYSELEMILSLTSGNFEVIVNNFDNELLISLAAYLKFVCPSLKKDKLLQFQIALKKKLGPQKSEELATNIAFLSFLNSSSPHAFLQTLGEVLPQWFSFHLGNLFFEQDKKLKQRNFQLGDKLSNYQEVLTNIYLDYLCEMKVDYDCFILYYGTMYDFKDSISKGHVCAYLLGNHTDYALFEVLKSSDNSWIIVSVAEKLISQESKDEDLDSTIPTTDFLRFLYFIDDLKVAIKLQSRVFKDLVKKGEDKVWTNEVLQECVNLKRFYSETNFHFEEVHQVLDLNKAVLNSIQTFECFIKYVYEKFQSLKNKSPKYVFAMIFLLGKVNRIIEAKESDPLNSGLKLRLLVNYQQACNRSKPTDLEEFKINHQLVEEMFLA